MQYSDIFPGRQCPRSASWALFIPSGGFSLWNLHRLLLCSWAWRSSSSSASRCLSSPRRSRRLLLALLGISFSWGVMGWRAYYNNSDILPNPTKISHYPIYILFRKTWKNIKNQPSLRFLCIKYCRTVLSLLSGKLVTLLTISMSTSEAKIHNSRTTAQLSINWMGRWINSEASLWISYLFWIRMEALLRSK